MFLAVRDLRAATGRFALVGAVIGLVAMLGVLLSGLATGPTMITRPSGSGTSTLLAAAGTPRG